jgi:hypothetical protein
MHKIKFFSHFFLSIFFAALLTLVGCASVKEVTSDTFETGTTNWDGSIDLYRTINQKNADEKCLSQGKLVDPIAEGRLSGIDWVLRFKCIDPSVKRQRELDAFEANKREQERLKKLAEEVRKRDEAKRQEAERQAVIRANEELRAAKQRADEEAAAEQELARKRLESENYVRGQLDDLKRNGVWETDVINLIVNFQSYKNKKVFLKCWISYIGSKGGNCVSGDEKQRIKISADGINKDNFRWLLNNCNGSIRTNSEYCYAAHILGTAGIVEGELALINVSMINVCQNYEDRSVSKAWNVFCNAQDK